jgi:two-component system heavy metal sensor histidine kinase CusS
VTKNARTLPRRFALWMCGMTLAGLAVFATAAYVVVYLEEEGDVARGVETDAAASARAQVVTALAIAAPVAIALSVIAAAWASRRLIGPIERATRTAAAISVDRFDRRMDVPDDSVELRALAVAINELLDRLQRGYLALSAFSADASHELRTPIAAVSSELETALRRPRTVAEWETSAQTSLAELHRLGSLVDSMLRFAQADATRDADATVFELADAVEDAATVQLAGAAKSGVALRVELGTSTATIRGHAELLGAAIANLIANALRVTPRGGEVAVELSDRPSGATIVVSDTGPGLPADRSKLFVPFARGGESNGVGLGLAITRRIVERHGGTIAADDRPGGGARFTIELPTS